MPVTPYVVGQWVRDERFYGRRELIDEILLGNRNCIWVLGTRRIGKTSLLKQLEHLASTAPQPRYFPIYWDFQGSEEVEDLNQGFADSLLDAGERLASLGIAHAEVAADDLFVAMTQLRRELKARGLTLLVLGDEVEELVRIHEKDPRFLRRLRRALQSPENIRTVLASSIRLWSLASEQVMTSPFLHGFTPPLAVRGLTDTEARNLIRQTQLPTHSRPQLDDESVEVIRTRCNNHPYLLQLLGERFQELGVLEKAIEHVATDQMVSFFFGSDLAMLTESERRILRIVHEQNAATSHSIREKLAMESSSLESGLQRLSLLGLVERSAAGTYQLVNDFFRRWFAGLPSERRGEDRASDGPTVRNPLPPEGAAREAAPQRVDGRYELLSRLGRGSSGDVYKAQDTLLRTVIAVKLLKREYSLDDEALERLRREVVLTRDLSHPNIIKIYHLGDDGGQKYITMQFVEGSDLARVISMQGPLPLERATLVAAKLAAALAALHRADVLHRDIKPSNVLIDGAGEPRLTDFGLARLKWAPGVTGSDIFLGTPAYSSPEQASGESLDERSDLYSLGIVLFEMVTGQLPFVGESMRDLLAARLHGPAPDPRRISPQIPQALASLILRCLDRDRDRRFQTARELFDSLRALRTT